MSEDFEMLEDAIERHGERRTSRKKKNATRKTKNKTVPTKTGRSWLGLLLVGGLLLIGVLLLLLLSPNQPAPLQSGDHAPDFTLKTLDGQVIRLSDYRGSVVLLTFWSGNCAACRTEAPALQALYQEYQARGVIVLGVNGQDDENTIRAFYQEFGITYPTVLDAAGIAAQRYGVTELPISYLINSQGKITTMIVGMIAHDALAATLNTLLAESTP